MIDASYPIQWFKQRGIEVVAPEHSSWRDLADALSPAMYANDFLETVAWFDQWCPETSPDGQRRTVGIGAAPVVQTYVRWAAQCAGLLPNILFESVSILHDQALRMEVGRYLMTLTDSDYIGSTANLMMRYKPLEPEYHAWLVSYIETHIRQYAQREYDPRILSMLPLIKVPPQQMPNGLAMVLQQHYFLAEEDISPFQTYAISWFDWIPRMEPILTAWLLKTGVKPDEAYTFLYSHLPRLNATLSDTYSIALHLSLERYRQSLMNCTHTELLTLLNSFLNQQPLIKHGLCQYAGLTSELYEDVFQQAEALSQMIHQSSTECFSLPETVF